MTGLMELAVPIVLSAVLVFVASSIIHMASPWHKSDFPRLGNEDQVMSALRPLQIPPGDYFVPRPASREDMKSPAFLEKVKEGPMVVFTVMPPGPMAMGRNLAQWFGYCVIVSIFSGYLAGRALPHGADTGRVWQFTSAAAFAAYALALWQMSIWYRRSWAITMKATVDGLIYGLLTAAAFGWLWPR
jgi:hypothetical protein